jgi:hypothetical protein
MPKQPQPQPGRHKGEAKWIEQTRHENVGYCPGRHCAGRLRVELHRNGRVPSHVPRPASRSMLGLHVDVNL